MNRQELKIGDCIRFQQFHTWGKTEWVVGTGVIIRITDCFCDVILTAPFHLLKIHRYRTGDRYDFIGLENVLAVLPSTRQENMFNRRLELEL